jgi:hypothetical protein
MAHGNMIRRSAVRGLLAVVAATALVMGVGVQPATAVPFAACPASWPDRVDAWWIHSDPTQQIEYCQSLEPHMGMTSYAIVNNSGYVWSLQTDVSVMITRSYTRTASLVFHESNLDTPASIAPGDIVQIYEYYTDLVPVLDSPRSVAYWSTKRIVTTASKKVGKVVVTKWAGTSPSRKAFVACANAVWTDVTTHPKLAAHPTSLTAKQALSISVKTLKFAKANLDCATSWKAATKPVASEASEAEKPLARLGTTITVATKIATKVEKVQTTEKWVVQGIEYLLEHH